MDTFAIRSNRVHSTCSGGDEDSEEKEAIRMEKELIRLDKEEIRFEKESIMLERESIRLEREAISLEKEAIRLEKEAIRSEKEAIRSEKEAVQEGLYEVEDVRRKRVSKGQTQYLIKWLGWPESHNTWEPIENLQECLDIVAAFEERLCSRGRKRKRKGTFSQPMKTETIDEEGKGNEAIDNLFSKSGAKWMTYENVRMFENDTSVLDLDDAQNGDKSEDGEGPTRHAAAGDQHEVEMFSNPCSNGVQDVCVEFAAISEPNLVLDREVLEEQSNASVCEANIATSVVLDSEVKSCSQDDRNFTVEVGSQPHPSERTGDHWKPCPTDLPCASKSAQGSPPRKTSCQQGSPLTEEVTQVNSKMSSHTSHESPRKSADDTTTAGLEVPNDKASPLKNELLLCKEECQDSEGGTDQGTDQFISIPDAPGKDDLLKSFTKTLEEVTPKKQIKRSWDSTLSTLSPRSLGVVKCVAPAEEIRPLGSIEGSNTEPSLVPTVQPSNLPDLNISIPTLASFQHPLTDSK